MPKVKPSTKPAPAGNDLEGFRAQYDKNVIVPSKIRSALETMAKKGPKPGQHWESELDFLKTSGLSTTDLAAFREQFAVFYVNVGTERSPKRVWFATKQAAEAARGSL